MDKPYQEKHGAFLLKCRPDQDDDGQYLPRLIATRLDRGGDEDFVVPLPPARPFATPSAAAEFALTHGKRWVRERLLPPTSA